MATKVNFHISAPRDRYIAGEDIIIDVSLENRGTEPLHVPDPENNVNWQPTWTLEDSNGRKEGANLRMRVFGRPRRAPAASEAQLITIAPGETWSSQMDLDMFFGTPEAGRYTLRSRMHWKDVHVESAAVTFTIDALRPSSSSLGLDAQESPRDILAVWLHKGNDEGVLFHKRYVIRDDTEVVGIRRQAATRLLRVSATAADVQMPMAVTPRLSLAVLDVLAWRDGRELLAGPTLGEGVGRLPIDLADWFIASPTWMKAKHLDVVIAGRDAEGKGAFALTRFADAGYYNPPSGNLLWHQALPGIPVAGATFYEADSDALHAVFLIPARPGFEVVHAASKGGAPPERLDRVHLAENELVDDSRPAVSADPSGNSRAGFVARSAKRPREHYFVEVSFGQGAPPPRRGVACSLDQPAVAARAGYGRIETGFRPDWALLTRNGDVYAHSAGDGAPLARTRHPSKATFEIAVVGYVTYLLRPAKGGLELLPL